MLYLSLGTNLGNRLHNIEQATQLIAQRIGRVVKTATPIQTAPVGFSSDNQFLNTAIAVETSLSATDILRITQDIERDMGRTQKSVDHTYHDRIIDIDLLLFDHHVIHNESLSLPHPELTNRLFVLEPLAEIAPTLIHPLYGKTISELFALRKRCSIELLTSAQCTKQTLQAINHLLPQLSASANQLSLESLQQLESADNINRMVYLLLRTENTESTDNRIIGTATLCLCPLLTGTKAWIEDVVVDANERGKGYARILLEHLIFQARQRGADSVNLTSRPSRIAANRLYQSLGFQLRETNVYKMDIALSSLTDR